MNPELAYGKVPPQATDLEELILGALLIESKAYEEIDGVLRPDDFYNSSNKVVFEAIEALSRLNQPIDIYTVKNKLESMQKLELAGGILRLIELTSKVGSSAHISMHAHIVKEKSIRRQYITASTDTIRKMFDESEDIDILIADHDRAIENISNGIAEEGEQVFAELVQEVVSNAVSPTLEEIIKTDIAKLDEGLLIAKSDYVVVAARPGMGKTALLVQIAKNIALRGEAVGIISLEMTSRQNVERMVVQSSGIYHSYVRKGVVPALHDDLHHAQNELMPLPVYINDRASTLNGIVKQARKWVKKQGVKMLLIDYIQLINGAENTRKGGNREQEISTISRSLKQLAKDLHIPVIALSQLSRAVESRADKRPMLSDLRESGSLEQDADTVFMLYRPEYYEIQQDEYGATKNRLEVLVRKCRSGNTGGILLPCDISLYRIGEEQGLMPF